ncbi:NIPSNAP family containing protein [Kribbella turkmenica]|uniref:NIPSNAP family containing protein n=1 Tax=Kribbella turkmenica TaxID=2530375 RepID=A0A4R4X4N8_9ACTN|nr:NIPSNAP family protein [Kribbella turkmenica]TDD25189.1 NIPSNAP family containing protein [Kribbella turkmenica]
MDECCAVVDLRQYTLHPGQRDILVDVFDEYFVEGQEAAGMHIVGQFRDLDDPDRFVWLRGFADLRSRADALAAFYSGPVWRAHSGTANRTMIDSDNALLLRPIELRDGYPRLDSPRAPIGATFVPDSVIAGAVCHRGAPGDGFVEFFTDHVLPALTASGAEPVAVFESLVAENNFPALPLRDEVVLAWFARFPDEAAYDDHRRRLAASQVWQRKVLPELVCRSAKPVQELRLRPTARSQFR